MNTGRKSLVCIAEFAHRLFKSFTERLKHEYDASSVSILAMYVLLLVSVICGPFIDIITLAYTLIGALLVILSQVISSVVPRKQYTVKGGKLMKA